MAESFVCIRCGSEFRSLESLLAHTDGDIPSDTEPFRCGCGRTFCSLHALRQHQSSRPDNAGRNAPPIGITASLSRGPTRQDRRQPVAAQSPPPLEFIGRGQGQDRREPVAQDPPQPILSEIMSMRSLLADFVSQLNFGQDPTAAILRSLLPGPMMPPFFDDRSEIRCPICDATFVSAGALCGHLDAPTNTPLGQLCGPGARSQPFMCSCGRSFCSSRSRQQHINTALVAHFRAPSSALPSNDHHALPDRDGAPSRRAQQPPTMQPADVLLRSTFNDARAAFDMALEAFERFHQNGPAGPCAPFFPATSAQDLAASTPGFGAGTSKASSSPTAARSARCATESSPLRRRCAHTAAACFPRNMTTQLGAQTAAEASARLRR